MGDSGFLSSQFRGIRPHFELRWGTWGSFCVEAGNLEFLLSCYVEFGDHVELQ